MQKLTPFLLLLLIFAISANAANQSCILGYGATQQAESKSPARVAIETFREMRSILAPVPNRQRSTLIKVLADPEYTPTAKELSHIQSNTDLATAFDQTKTFARAHENSRRHTLSSSKPTSESSGPFSSCRLD